MTSRIRTGSTSRRGRSSSTSVAIGRLRGLLEGRDGVLDEDLEVGRLAVQRERTGLRQGERAEVLDQPIEDPGLVEDRGEVLLVGRTNAVEDGFDAALDDGERRAKLVRDVGEEGAPLPLIRLESRRHGVEATSELGDRRWSGPFDRHTRAVIATLDPGRLVDEGIENGAGPADRPRRPRQAHEDRNEEQDRDKADDETDRSRRREDLADEGRPDREEPEDAGQEQRTEQAAEAAPWPPAAPWPALVFWPPVRPSLGPIPLPPRRPARTPAARGRQLFAALECETGSGLALHGSVALVRSAIAPPGA